jgi:hypothetical protein
MQPAPPVAETFEALAPQQPRRRRVVRKAPVPAAEPAPVVEAKAEEAPITAIDAPELRFGPGPAFAMSLRLSPSMQEAVTPPTSACMIEQTFNQLFLVPDVRNKVAENEASPARPLMMVAIKTGTSGVIDGAVDYRGVPVASITVAQDTQIK